MLLTKQELKEIHTYLKSLLARKIQPIQYQGLCHNIVSNTYCEFEDVADLVSCASSDWEFYSGNSLYPVDSVKHDNPMVAYSLRDFWDGEDGIRRYSLVHHIIKYIEKVYPELSK